MNDYKAELYHGCSKDIFYYSSEEQARCVCHWCAHDGGSAKLYKRTENGWEELTLKSEAVNT